jgi:hypothetical protein
MLACSVSLPAAFATEATMLSMNGPAEIEKTGDQVTGVTTGANTTVLLQLDAAHEVTVYQLSRLAVGDVLGLRRGTVRGRGSLTITTTDASVRVDDGEVTVAFDDTSGTTTVEVVDDGVEVRVANDRVVTVPAGQMVRIAAAAVTDPVPIGAGEISAARAAPVHGATNRNVPAIVVAIASACVLAGLLFVQRARALVLAAAPD